MTEGLKSEALFFEIYFFEKIPPSCHNGNPPPFTREAVFRKKMDEEFESLCPFCIIQKKGTGENPDTFPGAEGETRRVFNPSCSLCEQFILCPFLLSKKTDEEFESLQTNSYIQKEKAQRKNPCAFPGAEGETRRVFNPSCSLCEQFILCPFLLRKKMDEEFESL